jgi:hypothetical protein
LEAVGGESDLDRGLEVERIAVDLDRRTRRADDGDVLDREAAGSRVVAIEQ